MKPLRPFFSFFGSKWRSINKYPQPKHDTIIEPFAGSAAYSLRNHNKNIILFDKDPIIAGLWEYLIFVKQEEILSLPNEITHLDDMNHLTQEQKWLIGFWLNKGIHTPCKSPSAWMRSKEHKSCFWGEGIKQRIANQVEHIRHWQIYNTSYENAPNIEATWFIDPPYKRAGKKYRCKFNDYENLAKYCMERKGQVIVCENAGEDWLPFKELGNIRAGNYNGKKPFSAEVIWTND
jgi:site-specific DNA-adenine methylase